METKDVVSAIFGTVVKVMLIAFVVIMVYRGARTGYNYGYRVFKQEPMTLGEGRTVTVKITENMSVKEMGELFLQKGLIADTTLFTAQYYLSEFREGVKPGTYVLSTAMTVEEMMEVMATTVEETEADGES